jgi:hypothetical protein
LEEITAAFHLLGDHPEVGHTQRDLAPLPVKFWPVFSYLIVYEPVRRPLAIVRALHGSRNVATISRPRGGIAPRQLRKEKFGRPTVTMPTQDPARVAAAVRRRQFPGGVVRWTRDRAAARVVRGPVARHGAHGGSVRLRFGVDLTAPVLDAVRATASGCEIDR